MAESAATAATAIGWPPAGPVPGLVVYVWGRREQDRLLGECLLPAVSALRRRGRSAGFWFDRFNARGPHLFALLDGDAAEIAAVAELVEHYLAQRPSSVRLTEAELLAHHAGCRGKTLCSADGEPGMAPNNSLRIVAQPANGYPFHLAAGLAARRQVWSLLDRHFLWIGEQVASAPPEHRRRQALLWAAAADRRLAESGAAGDYWRYHAETLWPGIGARFGGRQRDAGAVENLDETIGTRNLRLLDAAWRADHEPVPASRATALVDVLAAEGTAGRALLREVNHWTLKNLGLPVRLHLPVALYGWRAAAADEVGSFAGASP